MPPDGRNPSRSQTGSRAGLTAVPGTGTSLDVVYRDYAGYVAAIGARLLGRSDDELDDLVQEVFVEAVAGIATVREPGALKGWLATITVRLASRRLRMRRVRRFFGLGGDVDYERVASGGANPEQRAALAKVYAALERVPVDERIAWTLRHVQGERLDAVAQMCGVSLATAKRRIAAAHAMIEKAVGHG
jgi:RNA polymerase sigma-70 factor (ECF subfamily)